MTTKRGLLFGQMIEENNALLRAAKIVVVLGRQDPEDLDIWDIKAVINECKVATENLRKAGIKIKSERNNG